MQSEPINTIPLQQFLQQVKSADASNSKEVKLDIQNAKRIAFTLGEVLARLNGDLEDLLIRSSSRNEDNIIVQLGSTESDWK
mgnify:FL=1